MFAVTRDGQVFGWGCTDDGALGAVRDGDIASGPERSSPGPMAMQVKLYRAPLCTHMINVNSGVRAVSDRGGRWYGHVLTSEFPPGC